MRIEVREELERNYPGKAIQEDSWEHPKDPNFPASPDGKIAYRTRMMNFRETLDDAYIGSLISPETFQPIFGGALGTLVKEYKVRLWDYGDHINVMVQEQTRFYADSMKIQDHIFQCDDGTGYCEIIDCWRPLVKHLLIDPESNLLQVLQERAALFEKLKSIQTPESK